MTPTNDQPADVAETHSAVVVFIGDRAFKIKKPVDLGFLDFRTLDARKRACEREVVLNRRLAPDVYLGVADVVGPDGALCEHVVVMRRMPAPRRLSACIARGDDISDALRTVAREVAALHEATAAEPRWSYVGTSSHLAQLWDDSFEQMRDFGTGLFEPERVSRCRTLAHRYLEGRGPLLERRIADGRIRDGHGDLQADDIFVLDDGPRILDCLDFSDELRWNDVLLDVAFLAMDLERLDRPDLASRFLDWHRTFSADTWPRSLADHYVAYRAGVRAKVTAVRHRQGDADAAPLARALFDLMERHLDDGRVRLVLVGGLPGTGKSTLARALAEAMPAVVLRTDELRRGERGRHHDVAQGRYAPLEVRATYITMLEQAGTLLGRGETVILDASWSDASMRSAAREVARSTFSDVAELCCEVDSDIAAVRLRSRAEEGTDPSEATETVAHAMAKTFSPWPEASRVSTDIPVTALVELALQMVRSAR